MELFEWDVFAISGLKGKGLPLLFFASETVVSDVGGHVFSIRGHAVVEGLYGAAGRVVVGGRDDGVGEGCAHGGADGLDGAVDADIVVL